MALCYDIGVMHWVVLGISMLTWLLVLLVDIEYCDSVSSGDSERDFMLGMCGVACWAV